MDPISQQWQHFSYDGLGRLTQIAFPINGSLTPVVSDIQYSLSGVMTGYQLPASGITHTRTYFPQTDRIQSIAYTGPTYLTYTDWDQADRANALNRLNLPQYRIDPVVTGNALLYFSQTYRYDPAGNRIQMTHKEHRDTFNFTYEYNNLNALIAYSGSINGSDPVTQRYTYDPQGNRTSLSQPGVNMTVAFNNQSNTPEALYFGAAKTDGNFAEFTHDKNGNRLSKSLKSNANTTLSQSTYTWDARNRMLQYQLDDLANTTAATNSTAQGTRKKTPSLAKPPPPGMSSMPIIGYSVKGLFPMRYKRIIRISISAIKNSPESLKTMFPKRMRSPTF